MRSTTVIAICLLSGRAVLAGDPFEAAALAPPDVRLFVHIDNAARLRGQLHNRPIGRWVRSWLAQGELPAAWERLANAAGLTEADFFDKCLGRRVTLMSRAGEFSSEWVVLTEIEPDVSAALLRSLSPRVLAPSNDVGVFHLAEQALVLARADRLVLIAPDDGRGLFDAVVPNLHRAPDVSLAQHEAVLRGTILGTELGGDPGQARAAVLIQHAPPLGGWSVAVAGLDDDRVRVRHASRFDSAPFRSRVTALTWDPSPLRCLEGTGFLGYIEPTDTSGGPFDAFVATLLGEPLISQALGDNLGARRITAVSDVEGRLEDPPFDLLLPTVARAYEVLDAARAWSQVDTHMIRLVAALNQLGQGSFELAVPDPADFEPGRPRSVPIGPMARWLFGDIAGIDQVSLNWTVAGAGGAATRWCIVASHPDHLDAVTAALENDARCLPIAGEQGGWTTSGIGHGRRLAQNLASWSTHAETLAAPEDVAAMRDALDLLRELAQGVDRCRWRMTRPTAESVTTEAEFELSPPESSEQ